MEMMEMKKCNEQQMMEMMEMMINYLLKRKLGRRTTVDIKYNWQLNPLGFNLEMQQEQRRT